MRAMDRIAKRKIDDMGRVVLPNDMRRYLSVNPGDKVIMRTDIKTFGRRVIIIETDEREEDDLR